MGFIENKFMQCPYRLNTDIVYRLHNIDNYYLLW